MSDSTEYSDLDSEGDGSRKTEHLARNSLAIAFATIERPQVAQRLILSARQRFPTVPIYVADQSLDVTAMSCFYTHLNVHVVRMPYDAGVCASRNRLAASIKEEFFVLCDDDFVIGDLTNFADAVRILIHNPEIGVVGGRLYDYDGKDEYERNWELFLNLDIVNRTLTSTPIYNYAPRSREIGGTRFYRCDAVLNFSVMRRAIFDQVGIGWDERFKSNGEHEDFFLNLKQNTSVRVAYLPTMIAYHHHPEQFRAYRTRLRDRLEGWKRFFHKWNIDQHLEIGLGIRSIDNLGEVVLSEDVKNRFFLNRNLSLRRRNEEPALLVGRGTSLCTVGFLDQSDPPDTLSPATARLLIVEPGSVVKIAPEVSPGEEAQQPVSNLKKTAELRHGFVAPGPLLDCGPVDCEVLFRYNPIARWDADFILWYRLAPFSRAQARRLANSSSTFTIHLRWIADDGRILTWESASCLLEMARTDYWVPLLVEVPMFPSDCAFLRFEVISGPSRARRHLATGFFFARKSAESAAAPSLQTPAPVLDVLALNACRLPEAQILPTPVDMNELSCSDATESLTIEACHEAPALMLLSAVDLTKLDMMFVFGWSGLGAPLLNICLAEQGVSRDGIFAPTRFALPRQAVNFVRFAGFVIGRSYCRVQWSSGLSVGEI